MIILIVIVFAIAGFAVSNRLKSKFKKYSQISLEANLSGADIAKLMLADNNIHDVQVVCVEGQLTDHYNPANKTVNLSPDVYYGRNAAAAAVDRQAVRPVRGLQRLRGLVAHVACAIDTFPSGRDLPEIDRQ